jgi:hypothetical protein
MTMKSGDMIEWMYKFSGMLVHKDEILWSNADGRYVPIGGEMVHFLVSVNDETYSWLNEKGLFHARVDDTEAVVAGVRVGVVVPRTRG